MIFSTIDYIYIYLFYIAYNISLLRYTFLESNVTYFSLIYPKHICRTSYKYISDGLILFVLKYSQQHKYLASCTPLENELYETKTSCLIKFSRKRLT